MASKIDEINKLRKIISKADIDYHQKQKPTITDNQYDAYKDRLRELNPKDPLLKNVGAAPSKRSKPVTLPFQMPSLDKFYPTDEKKLEKFLRSSTRFTASDKLDGNSALLTNKNGTLYLYTRGNGSLGTDISHLIPHLKYIPNLKVGQTVRGEIVISKKAFDIFKKKFKTKAGKEFENPRNLSGAVVNMTKAIHGAAKVAQFIIHEMVAPSSPLVRVASQLERMGGKVVKHTVFSKPTISDLVAYLEKRKKASLFDIDGIVLDNGKGEKVAFKAVNDVAVATVKEVTWQLSKFGYLTPVVWFTKPTRLAGAMVSKATGHNAKKIYDEKIGPGAVVSITRSGEVIPKLLETIKGTKASFPPKGSYAWDANRTFIFSTDEDAQESVKVKKLTSFVTAIGVKSFKEKIIEGLYKAGINTVAKLLKAHAKKLQAAGLGPTMSTKLEAALKEHLAKVTHPKMMVASGMFPRGFGFTTAKQIYAALGDRFEKMNEKQIAAKLHEVNGLGPTAISQFLEGRDKYVEFIHSIDWQPAKVAKKTGSKFAGMKFIFTGFRDAKLQEYLEHNGATFTSSVSKNTTYLVVKDKSYSNDKTAKAKDLDVKIITADQARKL